MKLKDSITVKILTYISLCIILFTFFGVLTSSALYSSRLSQRSRQINDQYLAVITNSLESSIQEIQKLSALCSSSFIIAEVMNSDRPDSVLVRRKSLTAQNNLNLWASSSPLSGYLTRLAILNQNDIHISSTMSDFWTSSEWAVLSDTIRTLDNTEAAPVFQWGSLLDSSSHSLSCLTPIYSVPGSYLYLELNERILTDLLLPYQNLQKIFITDQSGLRMLSTFTSSKEAADDVLLSQTGTKVNFQKHFYRLSSVEVSQFDLIVGCLNDTALNGGDNLYVLYVLLILLLITSCVGILVARVLTNRITRPIQLLTRHIRNLSETNNFSFNPEIECSRDEIGEIGKTVNQLTSHIKTLLDQQAKMYEQKKNTEINLLQSQINPHFLYNTLDSIRWMAVIQGSKNIENITRALSNLLRSMSKGMGDKITLREELSLVADYVHIQQVRYVEIFDYICLIPEELMDCQIIKFTLQPIIENAILHGIEPTGRFGRITLNAHVKDDSLYLTVEDDGEGMTEEELEHLQFSLLQTDRNALNGIGVANVDARLKLNYGSGFGLTYESSPGNYTRVTIHIPKENICHV